MKLYHNRLLSTTYLTLAVGAGVMLLGPALPGSEAGFGATAAYAACNPCNPCAAQKAAANPCGAASPCAVKKLVPAAGPCNPCAAQKAAASPCNPCAAKNPCKPKQ